jgi:hypothetical protein
MLCPIDIGIVANHCPVQISSTIRDLYPTYVTLELGAGREVVSGIRCGSLCSRCLDLRLGVYTT